MALATLERYTLFSHSISAEEAAAAATEFLLDHVGNQLTTGEPVRLLAAVRSLWIVPVQLTYLHTGPIGNIGVIAVDEETGQVIGWTPIDQMKEASSRLRSQHEPQITTQYRLAAGTPSNNIDCDSITRLNLH